MFSYIRFLVYSSILVHSTTTLTHPNEPTTSSTSIPLLTDGTEENVSFDTASVAAAGGEEHAPHSMNTVEYQPPRLSQLDLDSHALIPFDDEFERERTSNTDITIDCDALRAGLAALQELMNSAESCSDEVLLERNKLVYSYLSNALPLLNMPSGPSSEGNNQQMPIELEPSRTPGTIHKLCSTLKPLKPTAAAAILLPFQLYLHQRIGYFKPEDGSATVVEVGLQEALGYLLNDQPGIKRCPHMTNAGIFVFGACVMLLVDTYVARPMTGYCTGWDVTFLMAAINAIVRFGRHKMQQ